MASPIAAGALAVLLNSTPDASAGTACLVVALLLLMRRLARTQEESVAFTPLVRVLFPLVAPAMTFAGLAFLKATSVVAGLDIADLALICGVAALFAVLSRASLPIDVREASREVRIAVVGSGRTAAELATEMRASQRPGFVIVGYVEPGPATGDRHLGVARIGTLGALSDAVALHDVDLLLVSAEAPRMAFFEEASALESSHSVRVVDLATFYEQTFGHVPLATINATWFQWVMHPTYSADVRTSKRVLDIVVAAAAAVAVAPVMLVLAALIKRDGGPVFYRQHRVGEGGRPFSMLKLRSMRVARPDDRSTWTQADDDRVTRVGRFMRRTHLDEMPQLINVLRGDMSIVGPRPEQPAYVERLEAVIPFYSRRHLIRPGITGWAQINCGYAGSDHGTAWKLCHDLYYLKHRSMAFDLLIIAETVRTFVADRQFAETMPQQPFVSAGSPSAGPERAAVRVLA